MRLVEKGLTAAAVVANFHWQRVLPLMERKLPLFQMTGDAPYEGTRMVEEFLSDGACGIQIRGAKERQQAFLAPLPGIGNTNPRVIYLVFGLTLILLLHISYVSCLCP